MEDFILPEGDEEQEEANRGTKLENKALPNGVEMAASLASPAAQQAVPGPNHSFS